MPTPDAPTAIDPQFVRSDTATLIKLCDGRGCLLIEGAALLFPSEDAAWIYLKTLEARVSAFFNTKQWRVS